MPFREERAKEEGLSGRKEEREGKGFGEERGEGEKMRGRGFKKERWKGKELNPQNATRLPLYL